MNHPNGPATTEFVAALEHMTGPSRASVAWLSGKLLYVGLETDRLICIATDDGRSVAEPIAIFRRESETYAIEATGERELWLNGQPVKNAVLRDGDMIEFGELGPISRYRLLPGHRPLGQSLNDMFCDCIAYVRTSRRPIGRRVIWALADLGRRLVWETTVLFRTAVLASLVALAVLLYLQYQRSAALEATLEAERTRLEGVAASLAEARENALSPGDLTALRQEFERRLTSNVERLRELEEASGATRRVIAQSIGAVAFLQGAYGLRHIETGRMLRHVLSDDGIPVQSPVGRPLLSLEGDGPIAEIQFTGTGFLVRDRKLLVTNRHVAVPWLGKTDAARLEASGMDPVMLKFVAFFPGREEPIDVSLRHFSDTVDLAVLSMAQPPDEHDGLPLAITLPQAGGEVVVMGYPTGLRSLLAQSGPDFIRELEVSKDLKFWSVAQRLARAGMIAPLASRGIVGKVAEEAIVYDAETTYGGSGGPVLDASGHVIAVNTAILPEFGGSNLGVPVTRLQSLLRSIDGD